MHRSPVVRSPPFFFDDPARPEIYTLSLHDALPIYAERRAHALDVKAVRPVPFGDDVSDRILERSEEHTSELQSRFDLVCRLLLEKKNDAHVRVVDVAVDDVGDDTLGMQLPARRVGS